MSGSLKTVVEIPEKTAAILYDVAARCKVPPIDMWIFGMAWKLGYVNHVFKEVVKETGVRMDRRKQILERLADLWEEQINLGTTQGGGRRYQEHCLQHEEAIGLLKELKSLGPA